MNGFTNGPGMLCVYARLLQKWHIKTPAFFISMLGDILNKPGTIKMPKYVPTYEDSTPHPCSICGNDTLDENKITCCPMCEWEYQEWKKDYEYLLLNDLIKEA